MTLNKLLQRVPKIALEDGLYFGGGAALTAGLGLLAHSLPVALVTGGALAMTTALMATRAAK